MSKMRATIRIYEDPKTFTSEDVWEGARESTMTVVKIYAVIGLLSMAAMTTYAWKYTGLSSALYSLSSFKSVECELVVFVCPSSLFAVVPDLTLTVSALQRHSDGLEHLFD
ncbi:hypothetical protein DFJ43DRAFT_1220166 [Lentinula guzmanii]|uniref:Uncharacterized protein n=1 Tax=Lentinula guzmanii TaxID=2804957 RepID=A0AA38JLG1_9AGAR|nr:hypothetical protein DFJ43DRAFT_1220166 [Lentinula guzmanii]